MILWEENSLNDREAIFEFLYEFNPLAAEKTDDLIVEKVTNLDSAPLMGLEREGVQGRLLIIPDVSMLVVYMIDGANIRILRVLHQKQKFPS